MDLVGIVIIAGVLGGVGFLLVGTVQTVQHSKSPMERRLEVIQKRKPLERELAGDDADSQLTLSEREERERAPRRADLLPLMTKMLSRTRVIANLDADLQAVRANWRASELAYAAVMLTAVMFLVFFLVSKNLLISALLSVLPLLFPFWYVRWLKTRYVNRFNDQLADTLILMSNALKSGYGFMQAVEMVARESAPPMCDEFKRMTDEIQVGKSVEEALDSFAERMNNMDVNLVVMAVQIQREVGGALAEILDTIAAVIRERVQIQGEIRTLTTQGRMSGLFLAFMPVGLGLATNIVTKMFNPGGPSYMEPLLTTTAGKYMIAFGFVSQIIGFLVIRKIVTIEV